MDASKSQDFQMAGGDSCHQGGTANYPNPNAGACYPTYPTYPRVCPTCGKCPTCGNGTYYIPNTTWIGTVTSTPINYATAGAK